MHTTILILYLKLFDPHCDKEPLDLRTKKEKTITKVPNPFILKEFDTSVFGAELGIRTPDSSHYNGFQVFYARISSSNFS